MSEQSAGVEALQVEVDSFEVLRFLSGGGSDVLDGIFTALFVPLGRGSWAWWGGETRQGLSLLQVAAEQKGET